MAGILGRLFREFAVTITAAILISGVVSITLTPMLCSRFLRVVHTKRGLAGLLDRAFDAVFDGYKWSLGLVLRHRIAMVVVFVGVLAGTVRMYSIVPKGFIPDQDNDFLFVNMQRGAGHVVLRHVRRRAARGGDHQAEPVHRQLRRQPRRQRRQRRRELERADARCSSLPRAQRPVSAQQIAQQLRPLLLRFPNYRAFVSIPPALQIGFGQGNSSYNVTVQSADTDQLYTWSQRLSAAMETRDPGNPGRLEQPRDQEPEGQPRHRSRQGGGRRPQRHADRERAVRRLRPEVVVHDLRRHDAVPRAARARSEIPAVRRFARQALVQDAARRAHPAAGGRVDEGNRRPAEHQPLGPAARR